jgi:hypothetical protein
MNNTTSERGGALTVVVMSILLVLLIGAAIFGGIYYSQAQDYKQNVATKVAAAVADNTKKVEAEQAKNFAEEVKKPLKQFVGPDQFGSVHINYPKTWSNYAVITDKSSVPVDLYMQPDYVTAVTDQKSTFALRVQVTSSPMSQVINQYGVLQKSGAVKITPYELPRNKGVIGSRVDGQLEQSKRGSMIILPLRDKTLKIWTESESFTSDFNNIILPNASFSP